MITNEEIMDVMRAVLKTDVDENTSQIIAKSGIV